MRKFPAIQYKCTCILASVGFFIITITANPKKRKRKGSESLDSLQDIIGASSSFAKGNNWYGKQFTLHRQGHPIKCHRPAEFCGSHVSLYYEGFDTFTTECQSVSLDATDTTFVMRFCKEMASPYDNEDERMQIVREHLSAYLAFEGGYSVQEIRRMDGAITVDSVPVLIIEGKKEVGVGGCDSYMEVVAYYCNELTKKATYLRAPCFLVEIVGPHIAISGAVKVNYVMVDRLTDFMWMVPLPNNRPAMTRLAKVFKALKNALASLIQLYDCPKRKPQPQFPYFRIINDVGKIVYTEEIKQDVFIGELEKNSGDSFTVIVKFVEQYCIDAHRLMASKGYAPSVITFEKVTSRYHVVVMEYVEDAVTLHEYIQKEQNRKHSIDQLKDHCSKALCVLHESGFCHGDLRGNNILVKRKETAQPIVIVDFDWSGKNGVAKYPLFMNHIDLTWPEGATDGKFLHPDHDKYWIKQIFDNK